MQTAPIYGWNTAKTADGFKAVVKKHTPRDTPNATGHYADTETVKAAVFSTRARAKNWAQKWVRHLKATA